MYKLPDNDYNYLRKIVDSLDDPYQRDEFNAYLNGATHEPTVIGCKIDAEKKTRHDMEIVGVRKGECDCDK